MSLLFRISYSLVPKTEICSEYFSNKFLQKQQLCREVGVGINAPLSPQPGSDGHEL